MGQELVEVSILHVLCYHAQGVVPHAHAQQPDDVGVLQPGHDLDLLQEIIPWETENTSESQTVPLSEDCTSGVFSVQSNLHLAHTSVKLVLSSCSTLTSPSSRINVSCSFHEHMEYTPDTQHSHSSPQGSPVLGKYLLSSPAGWNCSCTYLAVLLTSDLSIFTATRTGW